MASSEIDAIFASKHKPGAIQESLVSTSTQLVKSHKKDKKPKRNPKLSGPDPSVIDGSEQVPNSSRKRPAPETIIDPSARVVSIKRRKYLPVEPNSKDAKSTKRSKNKGGAGKKLNDSQGSTSRKKTEEGWAVYKEDELGIGDQGGGMTHLCAPSTAIVVSKGFNESINSPWLWVSSIYTAAPSKPHEYIPTIPEIKLWPKTAFDF